MTCRYEEWTDYRNSVTDFIIRNSEAGSSVAILGAGSCNDVDIQRLAGHFSEITLVDRDEAAMREAVERNAFSENAGKIRLKRDDFTGIDESSFKLTSEYCGKNLVPALKNAGMEKFGNGLTEIIRNIYEQNRNYKLQPEQDAYDYVVVFGTHSQLNNNFSAQWTAFCELVKAAVNSDDIKKHLVKEFEQIAYKVEQLQRDNTQWIIRRFNASVISMARKGMMLGIETGNSGVAHSEIDGAYNALQDFSERIHGGELQKAVEDNFVWPFDKEKKISYDVQALYLKKSL